MKTILGLALSVALLAGLGCGGRDFADKPDARDGGNDRSGGDGSVDRPSDVPAGGDVPGDLSSGGCKSDEHVCNGACAKNDDLAACGPSCVDCTGLPNVKPSAVQCQGGMCVVPADGCLPGHAHCSSNPADVCETDTTKPENCGACGHKCAAAAPFCANVAGAQTCVLSCSGTTPDKCDTTCVDLKTDINNCGKCGQVCNIPNAVATCTNGMCVMSKCKDGYGDCGPEPGCETQLNTSTNCGACGKSCAVTNGSAMCTNGTCGPVTCNAGYGNCDNNPDCETPLNTTTNCGKCGMACDASKPLCSTVNGQQTCVSDCTAAAPTKCGNACVDTTKDVANCGGCNKPCSFPNAGASCTNSACTQGQCNAGYADCSAAQPGCETPLGTNTNCGHCGDACAANTKCDPNSKTCVDICTGGGSGNATHCCSALDCPMNLPVCSNHTCVGKPNGQSCSTAGECATGNCIDGVCCDKACAGQCEACDVNGSIGVCTPVTGAPHRAAQPVRALCGGDPACSGTCNGSTTTKCTYPANQCRGASCSSSRVQINSAVCDANGNCPTATTTMCPFACVNSSGKCGGSCIPGDTQCSNNAPQTCDSNGVWQGNTACSGSTPKCDPSSHTCVQSGTGDSCSGSSQCASHNCVGGVCCNTACNGVCDSGTCSGGVCQHKPVRTFCGSRNNTQPGINDVALYCDAQGQCVAPTIPCGNSHSACNLGTNACCQNTPSEQFNIACVPPSQCCDGTSFTCSGETNQRWYQCKSTSDCPLNQICCFKANFLGNFGEQYTECRTTCPDSSAEFNLEVCDPAEPGPQCVSGGTCHTDSGFADYDYCSP